MTYFEKNIEKSQVEIGALGQFDEDYFRQLEGEKGWIALGQDNCANQRYFTVVGKGGEKLGIIGVYDTDDDQNVTHTVVDPKFRGRGLAGDFKRKLMQELGLASIILTIDLDNQASVRAAEKLPGVKKVSDEQYEKDYHKVKYVYETPKKGHQD